MPTGGADAYLPAAKWLPVGGRDPGQPGMQASTDDVLRSGESCRAPNAAAALGWLGYSERRGREAERRRSLAYTSWGRRAGLKPCATVRRPPSADHRPSTQNHGPPSTIVPGPSTSHRPSTEDHRPAIAHRPRTIDHRPS